MKSDKKLCKECGEEKHRDEFGDRQNSKDGKCARCYACMRAKYIREKKIPSESPDIITDSRQWLTDFVFYHQ